MLWEFTAQQVLTMEYAPGVKINRIAEIERMGVDRKLLAQRAVESYLQQLLTYGFFHAGLSLPSPVRIASSPAAGLLQCISMISLLLDFSHFAQSRRSLSCPEQQCCVS